MTPVIDRYVKPRVFGRNRRGRPIDVAPGEQMNLQSLRENWATTRCCSVPWRWWRASPWPASTAPPAAASPLPKRDLQQSLAQVLPEGFADNDLLKDKEIAAACDGSRWMSSAPARGEAKGRRIPDGGAGLCRRRGGADRRGRRWPHSGRARGEARGNAGPRRQDRVGQKRLDQDFDGKSLGNPEASRFAVKKDGGVFDQFAGATITRAGGGQGGAEGLQFFAATKDAEHARRSRQRD